MEIKLVHRQDLLGALATEAQAEDEDEVGASSSGSDGE